MNWPESLSWIEYLETRHLIISYYPTIRSLPENDICIIVFRYHQYTQEEIATVFDVTQQSISKKLKKLSEIGCKILD
uniref:Putative sigma-70 region domain containing protein n=1 Tax=viral metagenome TaxID=1070528 RepID=A0A6M3LVR5_9ZZZZ